MTIREAFAEQLAKAVPISAESLAPISDEVLIERCRREQGPKIVPDGEIPADLLAELREARSRYGPGRPKIAGDKVLYAIFPISASGGITTYRVASFAEREMPIVEERYDVHRLSQVPRLKLKPGAEPLVK